MYKRNSLSIISIVNTSIKILIILLWNFFLLFNWQKYEKQLIKMFWIRVYSNTFLKLLEKLIIYYNNANFSNFLRTNVVIVNYDNYVITVKLPHNFYAFFIWIYEKSLENHSIVKIWCKMHFWVVHRNIYHTQKNNQKNSNFEYCTNYAGTSLPKTFSYII